MDNNAVYFEKTKVKLVNKHTSEFFYSRLPKGRNVIDLGCGTGCDTEFFLKNGFSVLAIDWDLRAKKYILDRLKNNQSLIEMFNFENQQLQNLKLRKNYADIVVAHNSLSYCNIKDFYNMWFTIVDSIVVGGYFVGNFWGKEHYCSRIPKFSEASFLNREEVFKLFEKNFYLEEFNSPITKKKSAFGTATWQEHIVIAKKHTS